MGSTIQNARPISKMSGSIFLFVPNIIGYVRILLLLCAFYLMPSSPTMTVVLYIASQVLDAFDGYSARVLDQSTMFGAVLDMVTDRVSTLGLIIVITTFFNEYTLTGQLLCLLDISSHWFQMYSTLICGEQNHKKMTNNIFLRFYYTNRIFLFIMCGGNELFFLSCYLQYFTLGPVFYVFGYYKGLYEIIFLVTLPFFVLKQILSIIQLVTAVKRIADMDVERREKANQPH